MDIYHLPAIATSDYSGVHNTDLHTYHFMKRRIFLPGQIDRESADAVILQLLYLDEDPNYSPISLIIDSGGGEVRSGLMIYDMLQGMRCPVDMYCIGSAASMAAILFASGAPGHRFILPHAQVMIHEPLLASGIGGSATSIHNISESIMETKKLLNSILARHTGQTLKKINNASSYDHYFGAQEAIDFGLCDEICFRIP